MTDGKARAWLYKPLAAVGLAAGAVAFSFSGCTLDRGGTQQQQCTTAAECSVVDPNCETPTCEGGFCGTVAAPDGPASVQDVGDCAVIACAGGVTVLDPDLDDKPPDGPCATFTCNGAELVSDFLPAGSACMVAGATGTCDGAGNCEISCEFDTQCPPDLEGHPCETPFCDTTAGICAWEPIGDGTAPIDEAGDCVLHLCEAGGLKGELLPAGTACSVDGGNVCDGAGACKLEGGSPCTTGEDCLSGFCPADDGVCCDAACDGLCESCSAAATGGADGVCAPILGGTDPGSECTDGACDGALGCKLDAGQPCGGPGDCLSGFCPADDGVCCDSACGGLCASCKSADTGQPNGTCAPVLTGTDPKNECGTTASNCNAGTCSGTIGACTPKPANTTCRPAGGVCDVAEVCDGSSVVCPPDQKQPNTTECRPSAGVCDPAETCTGNSNHCPNDAKAPSTTVCRAAAGDCDAVETCTGMGNDCPPDLKAPSTTVCRAAAGDCDAVETCTGTGNNCPPDLKEPSTTVCRAAAGVCDVPESCPGNGNNCPANGFKADGATPDAPGCGFYLCDGNSASCPSTCGGNPDCAGDAECSMTVCCLPNGVSCQGSASNCCSGNCTANGNGTCN